MQSAWPVSCGSGSAKGGMAKPASGQADAQAGDFEDAYQRKWIARLIVSAARSHMAFGLMLHDLASGRVGTGSTVGAEAQD